MGLFGRFRAKLKSNKSNKQDKSGVVCTKYKIYTEFDSNPTPNQPSTSYKIKQTNSKKSNTNLFINGLKTTEESVIEKPIETAPIEPVNDENSDRDNFKVHIVDHTDENTDEDDDKSEQLYETPTPLQYSSQAANIFFGSDNQNNVLMNNDNISYGSSVSA